MSLEYTPDLAFTYDHLDHGIIALTERGSNFLRREYPSGWKEVMLFTRYVLSDEEFEGIKARALFLGITILLAFKPALELDGDED